MANSPCPHCGSTGRYTDPLDKVRCIGCFNHVAGESMGKIGRVQDLDAPMVIGTHTYPGALGTWR